jgi:hypothetical protein
MVARGSTGALAALALAGSAAGAARAAPRTQACHAVDPAAVTTAVQDLFAALGTDDAARLAALLAPDFLAYDGGRSFDRASFPALIRDAHRAGKTFVWSVDAPQVHLGCDQAWIAYVNRGSVTDAQGVHPLTWLESAVLTFDGGRWRIAFVHSTRAAAAPPAS